MLKVNSKKAVSRLSGRSFMANKSRNIIAVLAIALTTVLFTALFTIGSGMIENIQRQTMRQAGGDGMGVLKYITDEEYNRVKNHGLIEEISYNRLLCDSVDNEAFLKRHGEFYYMDDTGIKLGFCEPAAGHKPKAENEIMMDTEAIKLLGIEQKVGEPLTLELTVRGKQVKREFVLSGWWEADPAFHVSILVTSRAYVDAHLEELRNSYKEDSCMTGVINSYIMFKNSWGLEEKLNRVITESGYSPDEEDENYIANNVNWSYLSTNFSLDFSTVLAALAAILLIVFTGYLIIYNIFQISVIRDIRFYGLLKTIGTTGKQVKAIIRRQALLLSVIGIPIGLLIGYFLGCAFVPVVMEQSYYAGASYEISANPLIFIGSTLFALVTVIISTAKPGRIAAKVSPVEAVRYNDTDNVKKKSKKARGGAKPGRMAAANLGRNSKRTVLVIASMALALVLFNTVYTYSLGFDMDKYLAKFVDTDFLIGHADYFSYQFRGQENAVSESMIEAVQKQPGFEEGGRLYFNDDAELFAVEHDTPALELSNVNLEGDWGAAVYGLEELPLKRLTVLEGEIDFEKLKTGKYILEGIDLHDDNTPMWETSHFDIGDKVTLHSYKGTGETAAQNEYIGREFEVMAKVAINYFTNSCRRGYEYSYYLPAEVYKEMVAVPGVMSYAFNVSDDGEAAMEEFLKTYTEETEPVMGYSSKATQEAEFEGTQNMVVLVGGVLSLIIGIIGVLNFVNSMLTSIFTRKREFAMLQSVGMTKKQLRNMLMMEGFYYAAASGGLALLLGTVLSAVIGKAFAENMWFFTYRFTLLPLLITIPLLLVIGLLLPVPVLKSVEKQSIVERLRETES